MVRTLLFISAFLLATASYAIAQQEEECSDGKVKTCFADGDNPACVCVDAPPPADENPPNPDEQPIEGEG